jgi:unsaturated chondroitin disaccharide hydrolase
MIDLDSAPSEDAVTSGLDRFWNRSAETIRAIEETFDPSKGAPVFTVEGTYTTRGWTEWTQGFQCGSSILQFDATGDRAFLDQGRSQTVEEMASHVTHFGVHDHGFNNVSTYGNLLRLMEEGRIDENPWERRFYEIALKSSGAVQAQRWTDLPEGGYIHSFNGPHSLFSDTIRSLRVLAMAHQLGHEVMGEDDEKISLLGRLLEHAQTTSEYNVYYGEGRDRADVRGRVVHESIFNVNDGQYRCPNTQQGYSPFTTWTRGLAWIICGYAEQLEFLETLDQSEIESHQEPSQVEATFRNAAQAACDFYIETTPPDGIPYWDTGAPGLQHIEDHQNHPADPYNPHEPVDSSAAAIAAQGLLRFGRYLLRREDISQTSGEKYWKAGLQVASTLFREPYLSTESGHQGLVLHSVYHWPNGWDHVPEEQSVPCGEATMWGDYHARELALYLQRVVSEEPYYTFFLKNLNNR